MKEQKEIFVVKGFMPKDQEEKFQFLKGHKGLHYRFFQTEQDVWTPAFAGVTHF